MATERRIGVAAPPDITAAPRVVLTWPLPCAEIDRPIDLAAVASDRTNAVRQVDFLIDGQLFAAVSGPPYRTPFDPVGRGSRTVEIEARAIATSGTTAASHSTVRLNGDKSRCEPSD